MDKREFPEKFYKLIKDSPFVEEAESASLDDLKAKIVQSEEKIYNIQKAKETDDNLNAAKNQVKEFSKAYREAEQYEKAKVNFCLFVMEQRGYELADGKSESEEE